MLPYCVFCCVRARPHVSKYFRTRKFLVTLVSRTPFSTPEFFSSAHVWLLGRNGRGETWALGSRMPGLFYKYCQQSMRKSQLLPYAAIWEISTRTAFRSSWIYERSLSATQLYACSFCLRSSFAFSAISFNMSQSEQKPKKNAKSKVDSYIWTDDEVKLLLKVTMEYKTPRAMRNVDWDSCQTNYGDILNLFIKQSFIGLQNIRIRLSTLFRILIYIQIFPL